MRAIKDALISAIEALNCVTWSSLTAVDWTDGLVATGGAGLRFPQKSQIADLGSHISNCGFERFGRYFSNREIGEPFLKSPIWGTVFQIADLGSHISNRGFEGPYLKSPIWGAISQIEKLGRAPDITYLDESDQADP